MTATLVYGGLTLTGGSPYEIMLAGADLGNPKPVVTSVRSLFLDGSVVTGRFSDNRTIAFQVLIKASTAALTTSALDALAFQVDAATNTITWTPDTGLPQAFDTFRGELHEDFSWDGRSATQRIVTVSMPALPFGRTPTSSTLTASTVAKVQLQAFTTATGTWTGQSHASHGAGLSADTVTVSTGAIATNLPTTTEISGITDYIGTGQAYYSGSGTITSTSIGTRTLVGVWFYQLDAASGYSTVNYLYLTLTSSGGSSTWRVVPAAWAGTYLAQQVFFDLTTTPYSTTGSGYSASAITGWTLRSEYTANIDNYAVTAQVYDLSAYPTGYGTASSADAGAYTMTPVAGSARTPVNLRVDRGGTSTLKDLLVFQAPQEADASYQPLLAGSSPYSTPSNAVYNPGTYTVIASIKTASQSSSQSVAASIQQTQGGTNVGTAWTSRTITSTAGDAYVVLGEVTLPLVGASAANTGVGYTVTITTGSAVVLDVFLLDTRGSLVFVGPTPVTAAKYFFISAPAAATGVGGVFTGSKSDLTDATSVSASARMSGGQMNFTPGSNTLVVCSTQASSDLVVTATYSPRWLTERTS